tara:strand:+ start:170 stop:1864 length:1695 start_codon:yes stop_codon:yes gene_type:complete
MNNHIFWGLIDNFFQPHRRTEVQFKLIMRTVLRHIQQGITRSNKRKLLSSTQNLFSSSFSEHQDVSFSEQQDLGGSLADSRMLFPDNLNPLTHNTTPTATPTVDTLGEDLGGSLSDSEIRTTLQSIPGSNVRATQQKRMADAVSLAANTSTTTTTPTKQTMARTFTEGGTLLVTPVHDTEKVCPVSSRRRRLRKSCSDNGLEVLRPLGRGSFGRIVLARNVHDGKYYAVKLQGLTGSELTPDQAATTMLHKQQMQQAIASLPDDSYVREYFETSLSKLNTKLKKAGPKEGEYRLFDGKQSRRAVAESVILDHLQSDHHEQQQVLDGSKFVVKKHGGFEDREWVYIILDYLTGGTLGDRLNDPNQCGSDKRMKESDAQFYLSELLMGLRFLRNHNVSHRDIKPNNIMIDQSGHAVLMDFGLSTRTTKGLVTFCGTAEYIAPEVLTQKAWDATMLDTWSFGVLTHKLLTGTTPFEALTAKDVFMNILINDPLNNIPKDCTLSAEAQSLVTLLLERDPEKRATIEEIMDHSFFKGVDWDAVLRRDTTPPWVPGIDVDSDLEDGIIHL